MEEPKEQSLAEIEAQTGEGSPGEYVLAFMHAVLRTLRWDIAMQMSTPDFRRAHAEHWVDQAVETGEVAAVDAAGTVGALAAVDVNHRWWDRYALANLRWYVDHFGNARDNLAMSSLPRAVSPDEEEFVLLDYRTINAPEIEGRGKVVDTPHAAIWRVVVAHTPDGYRIGSSEPCTPPPADI